MADIYADHHVSQPLLADFESSDFTTPSPRNAAVISLQAEEDGEETAETVELRSHKSVLARLLMKVRKRRNGRLQVEEELVDVKLAADEKKRRRRRLCVRAAWGAPVSVILFFGIIHIINVSMSLIHALQDEADPFPSSWGPLPQFREGGEVIIDGLTRDVTPIHCHSHNDYWRKIPLYDALRWGCTGVEADVWLFENELFIGHRSYGLTRKRTFRSMYVEPLEQILDHQNALDGIFTPSIEASKNGVYEVDPEQTLVLLVDFKNDGHAIYPFVSEQLAPLRNKGYLSYFNGNTTVPGPITVVATGNAPFDSIIANTTYRDIFFDAPLDRMYDEPSSSQPNVELDQQALFPNPSPTRSPAMSTSGQGTVGTDVNSRFDLTNSYYASVSFGKSIGWLWFGHISETQLRRIRGQIRGAKKRGLKARYWSTPKWPVGLRNRVWTVLVEEGVDYLNGDDLKAMTKIDWSIKKHWGWLR